MKNTFTAITTISCSEVFGVHEIQSIKTIFGFETEGEYSHLKSVFSYNQNPYSTSLATSFGLIRDYNKNPLSSLLFFFLSISSYYLSTKRLLETIVVIFSFLG